MPRFYIAIPLLLAACVAPGEQEVAMTQTCPNDVKPIVRPILAGQKFRTDFACEGEEAIRLVAVGVQTAQKRSRAYVGLLATRVCEEGRVIEVTVKRWVDTIVDWEGDEAYIVQYETKQDQEIYGIVWPINRVGDET